MSDDLSTTAEFICKNFPNLTSIPNSLLYAKRLTNEDSTNDAFLGNSRQPAVGDHVKLIAVWMTIPGSGRVQSIKLTSFSGNDIGWIWNDQKDDILSLIDTGSDVFGVVIRSIPFRWDGLTSYNGLVRYFSVQVGTCSDFHNLTDTQQQPKTTGTHKQLEHVCVCLTYNSSIHC